MLKVVAEPRPIQSLATQLPDTPSPLLRERPRPKRYSGQVLLALIYLGIFVGVFIYLVITLSGSRPQTTMSPDNYSSFEYMQNTQPIPTITLVAVPAYSALYDPSSQVELSAALFGFEVRTPVAIQRSYWNVRLATWMYLVITADGRELMVTEEEIMERS